MKRFLMLALAVMLALALYSCGGCQSHVDEDGDSVCDNCDEYITINVSFNVKYDTGKTFEGGKLLLERGEKTIEVVIDANGNGNADVPAGLYYVSFDGPYVADVPGIKIDASTTTINLTVIDNTPDGTKAKPFFISEKENQITLAPGEEIFYKCHASSAKYITVYNEYVAIGYDGETYLPEDGCAQVLFNAVSGGFAEFSIKNNSKKEITTTLYFEAPLGSAENPIELTENSIESTLNPDSTVYYTLVAEKDGQLVLTVGTEGVSASLTKILEGNVPVKAETNENGVATMDVLAGDLIKIEVSVGAGNGEPVQVQISLTIND